MKQLSIESTDRVYDAMIDLLNDFSEVEESCKKDWLEQNYMFYIDDLSEDEQKMFSEELIWACIDAKERKKMYLNDIKKTVLVEGIVFNEPGNRARIRVGGEWYETSTVKRAVPSIGLLETQHSIYMTSLRKTEPV